MNPTMHLHTSKKRDEKFLFRIKGANSRGGIANGLILPESNEYDIFIDLHLSAGRTDKH